MLSATSRADPLDRRLRTAGRIVPEMQVRLFDGDRDATRRVRGQPACRAGSRKASGILGGTDDDKLFTKDGRMCGDGRTSANSIPNAPSPPWPAGCRTSFCQRARTSAPSRSKRPLRPPPAAVVVAAAVAMPYGPFGERVCVFVELQADSALDLPALIEHRLTQGILEGVITRADSRRSSTNYRGPAIRLEHPQKANFATTIRSPAGAVMTTPRRTRQAGAPAEVWAPSKVLPIGVELSNEEHPSIAFSHLADVGIAENMAGHITWHTEAHADPTCTSTRGDCGGRNSPHPTSASLTRTQRRWSGDAGTSPPPSIPTSSLHRQRPDARVVVHNHPYNVSLIAALGTLPDLVHQPGALFLDDMYPVEKYDAQDRYPLARS